MTKREAGHLIWGLVFGIVFLFEAVRMFLAAIR